MQVLLSGHTRLEWSQAAAGLLILCYMDGLTPQLHQPARKRLICGWARHPKGHNGHGQSHFRPCR